MDYQLKQTGNGLYFFVIDGEIEVENQKLSERDAFGIWDIDKVNLLANKDARVLLMEVPMNI